MDSGKEKEWDYNEIFYYLKYEMDGKIVKHTYNTDLTKTTNN